MGKNLKQPLEFTLVLYEVATLVRDCHTLEYAPRVNYSVKSRGTLILMSA